MKKLVFMTTGLLLLGLILTGCKSSRSSGDGERLTLHETPQTYVLISDDVFLCMPSVTLYEDGSARLSQPPISSLALIDKGRYTVNGDELTVSHGENASAVFSVSDDGDTLTLKSASLLFAKVGAVYQYRSNTEYLDGYGWIAGEALTLEQLRELAKKPQALSVSDFERYAHVDIDPDYHVFDIEGCYTLRVLCDADGNTTCTVERNSSGESFPLNLNGSTGFVFDEFLGIVTVPKYDARKWLDFTGDEKMPWDKSIDLSLPEYPGVTFIWTPEKVTANGQDLISGMPVWNVYLTDLTNDGKPEICATVSIGSGISDTRVVVCDYLNGIRYELSDRMSYDYYLSMQDGEILVTQTGYLDTKPLVTAQLQLINGEIFRFGTTLSQT